MKDLQIGSNISIVRDLANTQSAEILRVHWCDSGMVIMHFILREYKK